MRNFILSVICLITASFCFGQEWTREHLQVLEKYGLTKEDPRGIVFFTGDDEDCTKSEESVLLALESFFTVELKSDLLYFCVPVINNKDIVKGQPMDLFQIVSAYLKEEKN
jgi:hypothetical protein